MRILEVARYKENFLNHVASFIPEQGEAIRALGHEVEYFLIKGNYIKAVGALKEKIREFKPDIIHAHFGLSAITVELQNEVPVVTTFHDGETHFWHVNLLSSLFSLRAKHVIYVAQHIRDLSYFKAKKYSIIPCGVPMEQMVITEKSEARKKLGWDAEKKYILFGGAFGNLRKNYQLLRSAVELLYKQKNIKKIEESSDTCSIHNNLDHLSAQEQALGQPSAQSCSIDSVVQTLSDDSSTKNTKNISFQAETGDGLPVTGWTSVEGGEQYGDVVCIEMKGLTREECVLRMCAADLFALPSHREGSPQALKEAMAVNCPCLATDIADVRYLFGDEQGHYILRNPRKTLWKWEGDEHSLDEMVELVREGLNYKGRTNGRQRIIDLGLTNEQVAKRIVKIYEQVLK